MHCDAGWPRLRRITRTVVAAAFLAASPGAIAADTVTLRAGDDIQAAVLRHPEGTRFLLSPGIYRGQSVVPRNGQSLIGGDGVVLDGAVPIGGWRSQGRYWVSAPLPQPLFRSGNSADGTDLASWREDLFVEGQLYRRIGSLDALGPGTWLYRDRRAYLIENPGRRRTELSATPQAVGGKAHGVVLRGLTIRRYATQAQHGAIEGREGKGWELDGVRAEWNHGRGLTVGPGMRVLGGSYSHNGQLGIGGTGDGVLIDGVEIAHNNFAGFDPEWEAGGLKILHSAAVTVRKARVHHNGGPGIWFDTDNIDTVIENNHVYENARMGIQYEISYRGTIRGNIVERNTTGGRDQWLWGANLLLQNSSGVHVVGNTVVVDKGQGIGLVQQRRGSGNRGPYRTADNVIEENRIVYLQPSGFSGILVDDGTVAAFDGTNRFDRNEYVVPNAAGYHWEFRGWKTWTDIRAAGLEGAGRLVPTENPAAFVPSPAGAAGGSAP